MKIKTEKIKAKDLEAGDLFSTMGDVYWNEENLKGHEEIGALAQKVYIRTHTPCPDEQAEEELYKVIIEK